MFCYNCGTKNDDNSMYCYKCGKPLHSVLIEETRADDTENLNEESDIALNEPPKNRKSKKGLVIAIIVILVLLLAAGAGAFYFFFPRTVTVDLNQYVSVDFSGYDSLGYASYEFDIDSFTDDYSSKIRLNRKGKAEYGVSADDAAKLLYDKCINGHLSKTDGISNGDTVTFVWACDDESSIEYFNCELIYRDLDFTAKGLDEIATFDAFTSKYIEISYNGIAPNATATLNFAAQEENDNDPGYELNYSLSPSSGLSNGDIVTVTVDYDYDYLAEKYGMVPESDSKTYTVEGLTSYITNISDIPADVLNQLLTKNSTVIDEYAEDSFMDFSTLTSSTYVGSYLFSFDSSSDYGNSLYMIYEFSVHEYEPDEGLDLNVDYYYYIEYDDLLLYPDGTGYVNLNKYDIPTNVFHMDLPWKSNSKGVRESVYRGYETLDALDDNLLESNDDCVGYDCDL